MSTTSQGTARTAAGLLAGPTGTPLDTTQDRRHPLAAQAAAWDVAVGRLVHAAAVAERAVSQLARALSGVDAVSAPYLLPLELESLVRIIRNLMPLRVRDRRLNDDVLEWTHQVRKLYAVRTAVVHTVWANAAGGGAEEVRPLWSNAGAAEHPLTVADLERTRHRLLHLCDEPLTQLMARVARLSPQVELPAHGEASAGEA